MFGKKAYHHLLFYSCIYDLILNLLSFTNHCIVGRGMGGTSSVNKGFLKKGIVSIIHLIRNKPLKAPGKRLAE